VLNPVVASPSRWTASTPDLLALVYSLVLAWFLRWEVKDLVWSLWLASLLVGYLTIILTIFGPGVRMAKATENRMVAALPLVGGLFMLAFFTVHFGGFHFVHSVFLNGFFPATDARSRGFPGVATYLEVLKTYWPFVLGAAVSERQNLMRAMEKTNPMGPYQNVIRRHLLIFFFAGAAALKLDSFLVYAVVLGVYFFPFKLLLAKRPSVTENNTAPG